MLTQVFFNGFNTNREKKNTTSIQNLSLLHFRPTCKSSIVGTPRRVPKVVKTIHDFKALVVRGCLGDPGSGQPNRFNRGMDNRETSPIWGLSRSLQLTSPRVWNAYHCISMINCFFVNTGNVFFCIGTDLVHLKLQIHTSISLTIGWVLKLQKLYLPTVFCTNA